MPEALGMLDIICNTSQWPSATVGAGASDCVEHCKFLYWKPQTDSRRCFSLTLHSFLCLRSRQCSGRPSFFKLLIIKLKRSSFFQVSQSYYSMCRREHDRIDMAIRSNGRNPTRMPRKNIFDIQRHGHNQYHDSFLHEQPLLRRTEDRPGHYFGP
jgi:hypothetical protein